MIPHHDLTGPDGAEVLVLSNSLGTALGLWDGQLPVLAEHFRVLRYDQRGHGGTAAPPGPYRLGELGTDVLELLDRLGVARAHFAGVSLGGMTGMWLAQHAPERIGRLALICTSAELTPRQAWRDRAAQARREGTTSMVASSLERWFTPAFAGGDGVVPFAAALSACDDEGYASCAEAIAELDLVDGLPRITAPTLVLAGREDPATPPPHAERIAAAVPGARLEVLDDASHLAVAERPDAVNALLLDHFTRSAR